MFGNRLKQIRGQNDLTLDELATKYNSTYGGGLNKGTLSKYENGKQEPLSSVIYNLALLFNVSIDWLMGRPVPMNNAHIDNHKALNNYLKSLGYTIDSVYAKEENGKWIEVEYKQFDENGKLQLPPNLKQKTKISKGKESVILTNEEFKELQDNIENIANYEIDKLFKNKG